jgi:imidazolonepropionase-like amidohydrolase
MTNPYSSTYKPYPGPPTLIQDVTVYDGEGWRMDHGAILFSEGKVKQVARTIAAPPGTTVLAGTGKWVTPGIIDAHSHMGDVAVPSVDAHEDGNELTAPVTPEVWAEHSVWPQDPAFSRALCHGGVTTVQILPGSGNVIGGRSVVLKNVYATTVQGMKFPGAAQGLKMAFGENPKQVYGAKGRMPSTRMGSMALNRIAWAKAVEYKEKCDAVRDRVGTSPPRDLAMETLAAALAGELPVHIHCYRADDMAQAIDLSKEFGFRIAAFHHAAEAYKVAKLLKANDIGAVVFAEQIPFKMEAYDGIPENLAILHDAGVCATAHSDHDDLVQMLNLEVAKNVAAARRMGVSISDAEAWKFLSLNPAKLLGIADQTGSLKAGKMADVVLWNGDPFSAYSRPEKVWIDGALLYDNADRSRIPLSDFELGQPGEGDTK